MSKYPTVIGRFEYVDIIDALNGVAAKIDTGAYRSSIHCKSVKITKKDGIDTLSFTLLGHPVYGDTFKMETAKFTQLEVKSSNGHSSSRYEVELKIRLGYKVFLTSFTLSDRSSNIFPILIGRHALSKRFLVDSSKRGVSRRNLIKSARDGIFDNSDLEDDL